MGHCVSIARIRKNPEKSSSVDFDALTQTTDVNNGIALGTYYTIANNLLKQADIYRGQKNQISLFVTLVKYSSLVNETIPNHKDYQDQLPEERDFCKEKSLAILDEIESLKTEVMLQLDEQKKIKETTTQTHDIAEDTQLPKPLRPTDSR